MSPMARGFASALVAFAFTGLLARWLLAVLAARPSGELLRDMAVIGATLLIAYAIEMSAVVRVERVRTPNRENWIGFVVGSGVSGLIAIIISLGLAERAEVNHWIWLDQAAFAFAAMAFLGLGLLVALLPWLHYEWSRPEAPDDD
jgi:Kef-type K+ transport system membrane component KefB